MSNDLFDACEALRAKLDKLDDRRKIRAYAIRKGRSLYVVSSEARELRRLDTIYASNRYA